MHGLLSSFSRENRNNTYTALNTWSKPESLNPGLLSKHNIDINSIWKDLFKNIPRLSIDNKLRQFSFKIHRILVTKKSYKKTNHLVGNLSNHRETSNHKETGEHMMESLECQACSQVGCKGWMKRCQ